MPLNQTWNARLKLSVLDQHGNAVLPELVKSYPGIQHIVGPGVIELKDGETYKHISLNFPLKAYPSVSQTTKAKISRSLLILTTDTPGVYYSIGSDPMPAGTLSTPRAIFDFSNEPMQFTENAAPSFDDETPRFRNYNDTKAAAAAGFEGPIFRFQRLTNQQVKYGGYTGYLPPAYSASAEPRGEARFIWGRDNPQNFGSANDSLSFCFWCKRPDDGTSTWFTLLSYPFLPTTIESDLSATIGTDEDLNWFEEMFPGHLGMTGAAVRVMEITQPTDYENKWRFIQGRKQDFQLFGLGVPVGTDIDWSRITACSIASGSLPVDSGHYFSPVFMLPEAAVMRRLDVMAVESILWGGTETVQDCGNSDYYDRLGASLVISAPPGQTARVQYFLGLV